MDEEIPSNLFSLFMNQPGELCENLVDFRDLALDILQNMNQPGRIIRYLNLVDSLQN